MSVPPPSARPNYALYPVEVDSHYFCWRWTGRRDRQGYGLVSGAGRVLAHRHVYSEEVGPIPPGLELDHWCRRVDCVNPRHLQAVKRAVNEQRKSWRNRVRMAACKEGHEKFRYGRRTKEGGIVCTLCK